MFTEELHDNTKHDSSLSKLQNVLISHHVDIWLKLIGQEIEEFN